MEDLYPIPNPKGWKNSPGGKVEKHLDFRITGFCRKFSPLEDGSCVGKSGDREWKKFYTPPKVNTEPFQMSPVKEEEMHLQSVNFGIPAFQPLILGSVVRLMTQSWDFQVTLV